MAKKLAEHIHWQPIGQRIVKTCAAVTICLLFYLLRGYSPETMPAEAAITAIICMDTNMRGTRANAYSRFLGTLIGAFWGFLFLVLDPASLAPDARRWLLYLLMGLGTLLALYTSVLVKKPDTAGLAAIVFICVVVNYPSVESPMEQAFHRILDVLLGTTTAIVINALRLPRAKQKNCVFFVRLKDLKPDQFADIPTTVLYRLQYLLQDGAKICLMSAHAPTFWATQFGSLPFSVPLIVMDGAAIYDANENAYLSLNAIDPASCRWLMKRLDSMNLSYFIYTVHRDRNCIFHHGAMTEAENVVYQHLKKSPYRYYLEDDHFPMSDTVYLKLVGTRKELQQVQSQLEPAFDKMKLRAVIRNQSGLENGCSLYFYSVHATMENAQKQLMHALSQKEPNLEPFQMVSPSGYRTEYDAIRLMRRLAKAYEPLLPTVWFRSLVEKLRARLPHKAGQKDA